MKLEPAEACSDEVTVRIALTWCGLFGVSRVFVINDAWYYRSNILRTATKRLGVKYIFPIAHSSWRNGTVERVNREVVGSIRVIFNERRRSVCEWSLAVTIVQCALDSAQCERLGTTSFRIYD